MLMLAVWGWVIIFAGHTRTPGWVEMGKENLSEERGCISQKMVERLQADKTTDVLCVSVH